MQLRSLGVAALAVGTLLGGASPALAKGGGNDTSSKLRKAVTVEGIRVHQGAFNLAALVTGGNRLAGTKGYDYSADYVALRAKLAGLNVSRQDFEYDQLFFDWTPPKLEVKRGKRYMPEIFGSLPGLGDFGTQIDSVSGDVTAPLWAADITLPAPTTNASDSACQMADFAGMPKGAIVLMQAGGCSDFTKYLNAEAAGAGATIFIAEGSPGDTDPHVYLFTGAPITNPSLTAQIDVGEELLGTVRQGLVGKTVHVKADIKTGPTPTQNVIAETRGGDPNKVIVVGAHLDSVGVGPGINDNGSGSAAILEMAEQLRGVFPKNKIRFVWFSAEESGLLGSEAYIDSLPADERRKIAAMLNFDMIGSPNFVTFVYDGDLSDSPPIDEETFAPEARPFSATIEKIFLDYFKSQRIPNEPTAFDGRSDYGPFIAAGAGIPAGGLFTGAEVVKTAEQAKIFGGRAGDPFDPCYHLGCDDFFNNSNRALDINSDAAAHALITLAQMKIPDRGPTTPAAPAMLQRSVAKASPHGLPTLERLVDQ
jgi:hypothetical protein